MTRARQVELALPQAWVKVIEEPDDLLLELIADSRTWPPAGSTSTAGAGKAAILKAMSRRKATDTLSR